jgi:hypothetical protein
MELSRASRFVGPRRLIALAASTLLVVAPALQAGPPSPAPAPTPVAAESETGTIKGRLVWAGAEIPKPQVDQGAANSKDAVCKAKTIYKKVITVDPETKGIADGIAYLVKPKGDFSATEKELLEKNPVVVVDQVNCEYVPYTSVVNTKQKLIFKSSDPVGHNVDFTTFNSGKINPMLPANGKTEFKIKAAETRPSKAICSIHPWMEGYVMIVDHPFAVVTKKDGSFEIKNVPAGEQNLVVWQNNKGFATPGLAKGMPITVKAGETTDVGEIKISEIKK